MISNKDIEHIAKLARLGLAQEEIRKFQRELSTILDYMEKLKEVDVAGVIPTSHSVEIENVMREDIEKSKITGREADSPEGCNQKSKRLLDLAPETKNGYLKVKSIL